MAREVKLDQYDQRCFDNVYEMLKDVRAKQELKDMLKEFEERTDEWGDTQWCITLEYALEAIEGIVAYERGYEGNDYWHETYYDNFHFEKWREVDGIVYSNPA